MRNDMVIRTAVTRAVARYFGDYVAVAKLCALPVEVLGRIETGSQTIIDEETHWHPLWSVLVDNEPELRSLTYLPREELGSSAFSPMGVASRNSTSVSSVKTPLMGAICLDDPKFIAQLMEQVSSAWDSWALTTRVAFLGFLFLKVSESEKDERVSGGDLLCSSYIKTVAPTLVGSDATMKACSHMFGWDRMCNGCDLDEGSSLEVGLNK